jgi:prolyl oligopeptidase
MPKLMEALPHSPAEPVTEILHGTLVADPYRWLEDQESPRTRAWIAAQTRFARSYLDAIPVRDRIRERVRELLDVETYDSIQRVGNRYFFRKRPLAHEQPCIFFREGLEGADQLLVDPDERRAGDHTALKLRQISADGNLVLYEVKEGGERSGVFEVFDISRRKTLPDILPRGYLRGFAFAPDGRSFYYVHDDVCGSKSLNRTAYRHLLGTALSDDLRIFSTGNAEGLQLHLIPGQKHLGFLVFHFLDKTYTDFYLWPIEGERDAEPLLKNLDYRIGPLLLNDRILAVTDHDAPNSRIVEIRAREGQVPEFIDVIPQGESPLANWVVAANTIWVSYTRGVRTEVQVFDLHGKKLGQVPVGDWETVRLSGGLIDDDEVLIERESFTRAVEVYSHSWTTGETRSWAQKARAFPSEGFGQIQVCFPAKDATRIPMFLVGRHSALAAGAHPTIMTSYGGYGVPMTPQFSAFATSLMEQGCLFALPSIRGGSEFGAGWHNAAKRRNRQVAFDDFIAAGEWLTETGRTKPGKLAIFGGSNSGLLVAACLTQRPDLFGAVLCMVPLLDMLRYHLFDSAGAWQDEFGTADDPYDFAALVRYSPYHCVREGVAYPATMIVSGDADQKCNPLHARKMTARLQAANVSEHPILLDYSPVRGHSPMLPLSMRIEALTDRLAFVCEQLNLSVSV